MKKMFLLSMVLLFSACGSKATSLDGTYTSAANQYQKADSFTFKNGKVSTVGRDGKVKETPYEIHEINGENIIKVYFDGGIPFAFILQKDGSLFLNGMIKYTKNQ